MGIVSRDAFFLSLVVGDHGRAVLVTVRDAFSPAPGRILDPYNPETWVPHNLTRVIGIRVPVRPLDGHKPPFPLTAAKLPPYEEGVCSIIWPPELFDKPGIYEGEMSLEYEGGAIDTIYKRLRFIIKERIQ